MGPGRNPGKPSAVTPRRGITQGRVGARRVHPASAKAMDASATLSTPVPGRAVSVVVCHCACPDQGTAEAIATCLVEERLAACVQILPPMRSVYRWQGKVERAEEVLLLAKTTRDRLPALCARIEALHPYAAPEVVALDAAGGSPGYLRWVLAETRDGAAG